MSFIQQHIEVIQLSFPGDNGGGTPPKKNSIQLPDARWTLTIPEPWYEEESAVKYFENLQDKAFLLPPQYMEAVEFAWYRTVRSLYPKYHRRIDVESEFSKWRIQNSQELKTMGFKGTGIEDATKAAVEAFCNR